MVRLSTYSSCLMRSRTILLKHLQQKNRLSYETGATNFSNNVFVLYSDSIFAAKGVSVPSRKCHRISLVPPTNVHRNLPDPDR
jgi:hypothetical protein